MNEVIKVGVATDMIVFSQGMICRMFKQPLPPPYPPHVAPKYAGVMGSRTSTKSDRRAFKNRIAKRRKAKGYN